MNGKNNKTDVARVPRQDKAAEAEPVPNPQKIAKADISFWLFITLALVIGVVLRLYLISYQILLDDEWHGMDYAIGNSFSYLFTHSGVGATCIPMNLYRWFLLNTFGWSELLLRLPTLAAGILSLAVFPVLVRKIFNCRTTIIFAFLLAISPFLIFYSRTCRPYSMVALLGFSSILALYFWATSGERKYVVIYVVAGVLAVYFNLFAVIAVLTPLGCVFLVKLMHTLTDSAGKRVQIVPSLPALTFAGVAIALLLSLLLLPALIQSSIGTTLRVDRMTLESLFEFACMLSGTANKFMVVLFWGLLVFGQILLLRRIPLLGGIFFSITILCFGVLVFFGPGYIYVPLVISRYVILVFPLSFLLVALGMDYLLEYLHFAKLLKGRSYGVLLTSLIAAAFLSALFFAGPLIKIYAFPNNFTNHSAFQESYEPLRWDRSYISDMRPDFFIASKDHIPGFYQWLSSEPDANVIIEYPMMLGDCFNLYYYYQHFHKKRIIAGYFPELEIKGVKSEGCIYSNMYIDYVLSRVPYTGKLEFSNMINVMNIEALRQSHARYIILHKNLMAEMQPRFARNPSQVYSPVIYLDSIYRRILGSPVFEGRNLIVFKIPSTLTH